MTEEYYVDVFENRDEFSDFREKLFFKKITTDALGINIGFALIPLVQQNTGYYEIIETPAVADYERLKRLQRPIRGFSDNDIKVLNGDFSNYFLNKIAEVREILNHKYFGPDFPDILPTCKINDDMAIEPNEFTITIYGVEYFRYRVKLGYFLAVDTKGGLEPIQGEKAKDPFLNLDACWITPDKFYDAKKLGYKIIDSTEIIVRSVKRVIENNVHLLVNHEAINKIFDKTEEKNEELISEVKYQKNIPKFYILEIIRLLLKDGISVYNSEVILETILRFYKSDNLYLVYIKVREALALQIGSYVADKNRTINMVLLSSDYLSTLEEHVIKLESDYPTLTLPRKDMSFLKDSISKACEKFKSRNMPYVFLVSQGFIYPLNEEIKNSGIKNVFFVSDKELYNCNQNFKFSIIGEINNEGLSMSGISDLNMYKPFSCRERYINFFLLKEVKKKRNSRKEKSEEPQIRITAKNKENEENNSDIDKDEKNVSCSKEIEVFFSELYEMHKMKAKSFVSYVKEKEEALKNNPRVKNVIDLFNDDIGARWCFYFLCSEYLKKGKTERINLNIFLRNKIDSAYDIMDGLEYETSELIHGNYIQKRTGTGPKYLETYKLTRKGLSLIFDNLPEKKIKNSQLIYADKIIETELFYPYGVHSQIEKISELLLPENFMKLQERLIKNKMKKGVCILLHGVPGAGKTETVYQIAKKTGRPVYKVDISSSRSMWLGESEKLTKKIFTEYKSICKKMKEKNIPCPILLLNEADAFIYKRYESNFGNCSGTENRIQNVFLEEIENLEGILMATTNFIRQLDTAYDRRFLFKVEYKLPDAETRKKIWKSKFQKLTENEVENLAEGYELSGGEIDNISRKAVMEEVLNGVYPGFERIEEFCKEEKEKEDPKKYFI